MFASLHTHRSSTRFRSFARFSSTSSPSIIISGAGPVGMTLFLLLKQFGIDSIILDRRKTPTEHPQAHFINYRTMEILRGIPYKNSTIEQEILRLEPPRNQWESFTYATSMVNGQLIGTLNHFDPSRGQVPTTQVSPSDVAHFSQSRLMPLLFDQAMELDSKSVWMGKALESFTISPNQQISVTIKDVSNNSTIQSSPKYLLACDGAHSLIRNKLQIPLQGQHDMQHLINVHFSSPSLGKSLLNSNPSMLYFIFNPSVIAVIVAHNLSTGEFVAQIPYYPPQQSTRDFSIPVCRDLVVKAVGQEPSDLQIHNNRPWVMGALVAEKYRQGNVFLVGDAAHQFPPAGGFGMNTGIQDAHNLAWKLAMVFKFHQENILDTYEQERKPVAEYNARLSVRNWHAATAVPSSLGLDPNAAHAVTKIINMLPGSTTILGKTLLQSTFALARAALASETTLSNSNPLGQARIASARRVLEEGKSLRLLFPNQDLGFGYESDLHQLDGWKEYIPEIKCGHRFPHYNIKIGEWIGSTVDLMWKYPGRYILMVNGMDGIEELAKDYDAIVLNISEKQESGINVSGITIPHGAVLVRPDGHIAKVYPDDTLE